CLVESTVEQVGESQAIVMLFVERIAGNKILSQCDRLIEASEEADDQRAGIDDLQIDRIERQTVLNVPGSCSKVALYRAVHQRRTGISRCVRRIARQRTIDRLAGL